MTRSSPLVPAPPLAVEPALLVAGFALGSLLATHAIAQSDPVVAKVNGVEIKESDLKAAEEDIGAQLPPMAPEAKKEYLITYVSDMILVSKAAEAKKLGDTADFKRKLANARTKLLMEALLQSEAKAAVTDDAMKKVYADAIKDVGSEQEVSARHILVESEDDAKSRGRSERWRGFRCHRQGTFEGSWLQGPGRRSRLLWQGPDGPEFAEAAFKLEKGQTSDPVKSQFGWHIIRVDDKRTKQPPSFDQVKDQIESYVQRKAQADLIQKLRTEAKIEKVGGDKPDAAAPAAPAAPAAKPDAKAPAKK